MCGVFSKGCGHCKNMKPAWNQLKSATSSMPGDGSLIEIDSSILPQIQIPALTNRISGYPTILLFRNGVAKEEYGGDRSFQDMHRFLKQHIDSNSHNRSHNHSQEKHEVKAINDDYDTTTDEEHDTSSDEEDDVVKKPKIANKKKLSSKKLSLKKSSGIKKSKRRRERKKTTLKGGTRKKAKKAKKARKKMRSRHHHKSIGCCNKRRCGPECICGTRCNPKCRCPCCK